MHRLPPVQFGGRSVGKRFPGEADKARNLLDRRQDSSFRGALVFGLQRPDQLFLNRPDLRFTRHEMASGRGVARARISVSLLGFFETSSTTCTEAVVRRHSSRVSEAGRTQPSAIQIRPNDRPKSLQQRVPPRCTKWGAHGRKPISSSLAKWPAFDRCDNTPTRAAARAY